MIKKQDDLVGSLLHDVAHLIRLHIDRSLKEHELTRVKWLALGVLKERKTMSQTELATALELGDAPTGRLVDRLEGCGLVKRRKEESDRRVRKLALTPKSVSLLKNLEGLADDLCQDILDGVTDSDLQTIVRNLIKMKNNLRSPLLVWPMLCFGIMREANLQLSDAPMLAAQFI